MADLTTLANAKSWLGVSSSTDDALLQRLVTAASRLIETWCGRSFSGVVSFTETRNGPGGQRIDACELPGHRAVVPVDRWRGDPGGRDAD